MVVRNRKTRTKNAKLMLPNAKNFLKTFALTIAFYIGIMLFPVIFNSKWILLVIYFSLISIFIGGTLHRSIKRQLIFDKFLISVFTLPLMFLSQAFFISHSTLNQAILELTSSKEYLVTVFGSTVTVYLLLSLKTYQCYNNMNKGDKI